jgi:hypothetical protein
MPPTGSFGAAAGTAGEPFAARPLMAAVEPGAGPGADWAGAAAPLRQGRDPGPSLQPGPGREGGAGTDATIVAAVADPRMASVVRLETVSHRGGGFYVAPRLVVTTADLVGAASVIDVTTSDGEDVLGLVVHTDAARNLAVVHVPRSGRPAPLHDGAALAATVEVLELLGQGRARITLATLPPPAGSRDGANGPGFDLDLAGAPAAAGAPVFLGEHAVGLTAAQDGGARPRFVPIEGLAAMLRSEGLAVLR